MSKFLITGYQEQDALWKMPLEFWLHVGDYITQNWLLDHERVNALVKATCVLHNFIQGQISPAQVTTLLQETIGVDNAGLQAGTLRVGVRGVTAQGARIYKGAGLPDHVYIRN